MRRTTLAWRSTVALACGVAWLACQPAHAEYTVQRVVGGLNQPIHMAQAPGDNTSLYLVERADSTTVTGRIRKYDLQTQTLTTFLDVDGTIASDGGLLSMTFHPDYQTNGLFYIVTNNSGTNGLDEYKVTGGVPAFQRRIMQYQNLNNVYHTMNQVHFRPGGNNNELFLTTGDGGTQANDPGFNPALIESPTSPYGKVMKVDLTHNFATPASAPGPGTGISVVALGIRNPFRSGFDRATGDFYFGDVGFERVEELDFIPGSHFTNPSAPVLDFGWTSREGTIATPGSTGGPGSPGDIRPIFEYHHGGSNPFAHPNPFVGVSITGGYVYRGPVTELQGRYFFADFANGNVYSGNFDNTTPVASYNGANITGLTNHTNAFEALVGPGTNIQWVTSFAEDNAGNLYIVKFGNSFFPPLGQGEIFKISPVLSGSVLATIDRNSGEITLANATGAPIAFTSYTMTSTVGAIDAADFTPITGHYDSVGNGSVDNNNPWQITSPAGSHTLFREATTGDAGALAANSEITLAPAGGWIPSPTEDVFLSLLLDDGAVLNATVAYTGNGGDPFARGDLDFDGDLDVADWTVLVNSSYAPLAPGLSRAQSYAFGDLDGDNDADFADFRLFKADFDEVNGVGAFEAMTRGVPEPGAATLVLAVIVGQVLWLRRRPSAPRPLLRSAVVPLAIVAAASCVVPAREAHAVLAHRYSFSGNANDSVGVAHGTVVDGGAPTAVFSDGQLDLSANTGQGSNTASLNDAYVNLPNGIISAAASSGTSGAFSLEFWATVSAQDTWQRFGDFGLANGGEDSSDNGSARDYVYITPNSGRFDNGLATEVHQANGDGLETGLAGPFPLGVQVHVVGTYDHSDLSSGANGAMHLYLDGALIGDAPLPTGINLRTFDDDNNWLGRSQWNDPVFQGLYNEFRIYDHPLTASEVATNFVAGPDTVAGGSLLGLEVFKDSGAARIRNLSDAPLSLDFYRITSAASALSVSGWNSLDDQNIAAADGLDEGTVAGDSKGEGWDESGAVSSSQLVELFLGTAGSTLAPGQAYNLGAAFNTSVFGVGNNGDLQMTFGVVGGVQLSAEVTYLTGNAPGDFDNSGRVDGNDLLFWQRSIPPLTGDDLNTWKTSYGNAAAAAGAIPEPATFGLCIASLFCLVPKGRRRYRGLSPFAASVE